MQAQNNIGQRLFSFRRDWHARHRDERASMYFNV